MADRHDPVIDAARRVALGLAAFDLALGLVAMRRPDTVRRLFGREPGHDGVDAMFYSRWGVQILGYAAVQALAAAFPTPATLSAVAALRAVEVPADFLARSGASPAGRVLLPAASAVNAAATALFAAAARRARWSFVPASVGPAAILRRGRRSVAAG